MSRPTRPRRRLSFDPWDIAFGAAIANDYVFRGITQSNHKPSVAAYFEPRYNITKDLQLYAGVAGASISFPNRAAAEIDVYGGIRPTFGAVRVRLRCLGLPVSGWAVLNSVAFPAGIPAGVSRAFGFRAPMLSDQRQRREEERAASTKATPRSTYTFNDMFALGANEYYSPNFLNFGAWGNYASITASSLRRAPCFGVSGVGMYISGEFGRQWLGTTRRLLRLDTRFPVAS